MKPFGDPIYPALTSVGSVDRSSGRPYHAVINGENFHALQLLAYSHEGQVDCIYIDPPYNSGARDWKYNNRYVDETDRWRHSKWLSMMEKRLRIAKRLLKADGVLIVTVDENEVQHLGMLLEQIMPEYLRHMITIVINPKGTYKVNFGRVDEYAFFCVPSLGRDVIEPRPTSEIATDEGPLFDLDSELPDEDDPYQETTGSERVSADYEDWFLRRRGAESSYRHQRPNSFYAILVDEAQQRVVGVGPPLGRDDPWKVERSGNVVTYYPIDDEGNERVWRYVPATMQRYIDNGEIVVGRWNEKTETHTLNHRKPRSQIRRLKTVWWDRSHDAGVHGTTLLNRMLGERSLFPFPKSPYAVRDSLAAVCRSRPDALIVDFFAGSGTTFHATCLLNAQDGGQRRSILVTNNEVDPETARRLVRSGHYPGDVEYEAQGIFERVTRPRVEATITGLRPDGTPIPGNHVGGRPLAQGFEENVEFFRLDYLDPDEVDLGTQFNAILPILWLAAGAVGRREVPTESAEFTIPDGSSYGVLFRESRFRQFRQALEARPDVSNIYLITDSEEAYAEMRSALPQGRSTSMLYRDYLRNFRINTERNL